MKRKLCTSRGETLIEVMVSLVVVIMIISMLPLALETAAKINAQVRDIKTVCARTGEGRTPATVTITDSSGSTVETVEVYRYTEDGFTYYTGK